MAEIALQQRSPQSRCGQGLPHACAWGIWAAIVLPAAHLVWAVSQRAQGVTIDLAVLATSSVVFWSLNFKILRNFRRVLFFVVADVICVICVTRLPWEPLDAWRDVVVASQGLVYAVICGVLMLLAQRQDRRRELDVEQEPQTVEIDSDHTTQALEPCQDDEPDQPPPVASSQSAPEPSRNPHFDQDLAGIGAGLNDTDINTDPGREPDHLTGVRATIGRTHPPQMRNLEYLGLGTDAENHPEGPDEHRRGN